MAGRNAFSHGVQKRRSGLCTPALTEIPQASADALTLEARPRSGSFFLVFTKETRSPWTKLLDKVSTNTFALPPVRCGGSARFKVIPRRDQ